MKKKRYFHPAIWALLFLAACTSGNEGEAPGKEESEPAETTIQLEVESFVDSSGTFESGEAVTSREAGWLAYDVPVAVTGRYKFEIRLSVQDSASVWVEDYADNQDERTFNITGSVVAPPKDGMQTLSIDGSPLDTGVHRMKLHFDGPGIKADWFRFTLMREHQDTPVSLTQDMKGDEWVLAWSDEFNGQGLPDTSKWTFDIGNWGWGNNEAQYYTAFRTENARQEDGHLIIEARKDDMGYPWTSARLTTRGKVSFTYGKIEFRGRVPAADGCWAAGWLLGDEYRDEKDWPYCGEIDVLEVTGREIDDETGNGINHASCHTRAYYFKKNNHITSTIPVENMVEEFHDYTIEWRPTGIKAFLDGQHYYTYDKLDGKLEWPFNEPQNIILNLAMGGGMGGAIDPGLESAQLVLDYVRVYALK